MANKLMVACVLLAVIVLGQSQWTGVSTSTWQSLVNEIYFKTGLGLCKDRMTEAGYTFKSIYVIRLGPGVEYTLNDTLNNVHVCVCLRIPPPKYMNLSQYYFFPGGQMKQETVDVIQNVETALET